MRSGDLVQYPYDGYDKPILIGIVLEVKQYDSSERVDYSFKLLESNGTRKWYDVWKCDTFLPEIVRCV